MNRIACFALLLLPTLALGGGNEVNVTTLVPPSPTSELGQVPGTFEFTRASSAGSLTVNVTIGGTAANNDFSFDDGGTLIAFGTVTFNNGQSSRTITLTPRLDNLVEGQEQFDVTVAAGSGYTIGSNSSASITVEDDPPVVTLEATDASADEAGQDPMVFRFSRTGGNIGQNLTVNVTIDPSTTANLTGGAPDLSGDDGGTLAAFQTVTIFGNNAFRDVTFTPVLDNRIEPVEQLDLSLAAGSYNIDTPNSGSATLADDPPVVTLEATDASADEAGQDPMVFRFSRTGGNIGQNLTVNVTIDPSTTANLTGANDISGDDGGTLAAFQTVTIFGNNAFRDVTFTPVLDNRVEPVEQLDLSLAAGSYNIDTPNSGSATLADDPPVVSISVVQPEAAEGGPAGVLSLDRTGGNVNQVLTVNAMISAASTVVDSDFTVDDGGTLQVFGTVNIQAGQASRELGFTAVLDDLTEGEETLILELQGGSYVQGTPATGTLIFVDDRLFADGFEIAVGGLKSCSLTDTTKLSPLAFDVVGSQALQLSRNLIWLRCSPLQHYDWLGDLCGGAGGSLSPDADSVLADFNAGLLGDHAGVGSWRLATALEKSEAGFTGTCFVR
ncbi:MAG: Calx-beta domain-containing protein [Pseudomonadota bacterium]